MTIKSSFTAAETLPIKLLKDEQVINSINNLKIIPPIHVQFIPTNKCNLNCSFCSCANEDRNIEMSIDEAMRIIDICKNLGTRAVTITGGGSPCLHPNINEIIEYFINSGIEVGFVDNGLALDKIKPATLNKMTWCRISHADFRPFTNKYKDILASIMNESFNIDWAFSYVVSKNYNFDTIVNVIDFANQMNLTHVRLVADILDPTKINMGKIKEEIIDFGVDDSKVVYQNRDIPTSGGDCYICYLKPVISADCKVFACCGAQYYKKDAPKKMPNELCLGSAFDLSKIIENSTSPINGRICEKCYYRSYNDILSSMMSDLKHINFI